MINNCTGKGECLKQDLDGNFYGGKTFYCENNCEPIKCPNYILCNNIRSKNLLNSFENVCLNCNMFFGSWRGWNNILKQEINDCKECLVENTVCILNEKNKNFLCIECFKKLYFP